MVTPFHHNWLHKHVDIPNIKRKRTMQALLIVLVLLVEALWLALDKCWLDMEQEAVLARYLPDRDHC